MTETIALRSPGRATASTYYVTAPRLSGATLREAEGFALLLTFPQFRDELSADDRDALWAVWRGLNGQRAVRLDVLLRHLAEQEASADPESTLITALEAPHSPFRTRASPVGAA